MHDAGLKLVLAGPMGAGKTTALQSLADSAPVSTEMPITDGAMGEKTTTTVALDFATVMLDGGTPVQLFGMPGQAHFSYMRRIILKGAFGVVLLLGGDDPDVATQCREWVASVREDDPDMPIVIGITKTDTAPDFRIDTVRAAVQDSATPIPIFTVDAREREQASQLVRVLLLTLG